MGSLRSDDGGSDSVNTVEWASRWISSSVVTPARNGCSGRSGWQISSLKVSPAPRFSKNVCGGQVATSASVAYSQRTEELRYKKARSSPPIPWSSPTRKITRQSQSMPYPYPPSPYTGAVWSSTQDDQYMENLQLPPTRPPVILTYEGHSSTENALV